MDSACQTYLRYYGRPCSHNINYTRNFIWAPHFLHHTDGYIGGITTIVACRQRHLAAGRKSDK